MKRLHNVVLKFGTETLIRDGVLDQSICATVARQIAEAQKRGVAVTIVSSGAIKAGRASAEALGLDTTLLRKQDLAGIGARYLLNLWGSALVQMGTDIAQVWVTHANWSNASERDSIRSALSHYHRAGIVPIVNENDVVSAEEIALMERGISENDQLARMVAELVSADGVLFLTKSGGVYERDPDSDPEARRFRALDRKTMCELVAAAPKASQNGRGGMGPKLLEAFRCHDRGVRTVIAGVTSTSISDFVHGRSTGTRLASSTRF